MKTRKTLRTQLAGLCLAALCAGVWPSCDRKRTQRTEQRENQPGPSGDWFATEDAETAGERARFEQSMRETADAFESETRGLKNAIARLPSPRREEGDRLVADLEKKLAGFRVQIADMEKAEGAYWADCCKAVLGSSLDVKGHLNRAAELVTSGEAEEAAGPQ